MPPQLTPPLSLPLAPGLQIAKHSVPIQHIPWVPRGLGIGARGSAYRGGGGLGKGSLRLPVWGLPDSGLRVREIYFVCPKPVDHPGSIIFVGAVNARGDIQSARVEKSNWDDADQSGVIWAVRQWRFAPLVVDGRPTPFQIVAKIHVPLKPKAKAICGGLLIGGYQAGRGWHFSPFTWVLEPVQHSEWIAFSVSRVQW